MLARRVPGICTLLNGGCCEEAVADRRYAPQTPTTLVRPWECSGFPSFVAVLTKVLVPTSDVNSPAQPNNPEAIPSTHLVVLDSHPQHDFPTQLLLWHTVDNRIHLRGPLRFMSHPATLPLRMHVSPNQGAPPATSHGAGKSLNQGPQPPTRRLQNGESLTRDSALAARMPDVSLPAGPPITDLAALSLPRIQCRLNWQSMCLSFPAVSRKGSAVHLE
jgi:hypothetical protein